VHNVIEVRLPNSERNTKGRETGVSKIKLATNLLGQRPPSQVIHSITLVGLSQKRVERLGCSIGGSGVAADCVCRHITHLLARVIAVCPLVQQVGILEILSDSLAHGEGFVEVDLGSYDM